MNLSDQLAAYLRTHGVVNIVSRDRQMNINITVTGYPAVVATAITRVGCLTPIVFAGTDIRAVVTMLLACSDETRGTFSTWLISNFRAA